MGKPSNRKRSAQRLGKHERARVKRRIRISVYITDGEWHAAGVGHVRVKAGWKKLNRTLMAVSRLAGDSIIPNALVSVGRPAYKADTSTITKSAMEF